MPSRPQLKTFIGATFRSVWALELLLFLKRDGDSAWTRQEIVAGLRASELILSQNLDALVAAGLVSMERDSAARFSPASRELETYIDAVEKLYTQSPDAVRRLIIMSNNAGPTAFADSFRIRKD